MSLKVRNFATLSSMCSGFAGRPGTVYNLTFLLKHCEACINAKYTSDQASRALWNEVEGAPFPLWFLFCFWYSYAWFCLCILWGRLLWIHLVEHMYIPFPAYLSGLWAVLPSFPARDRPRVPCRRSALLDREVSAWEKVAENVHKCQTWLAHCLDFKALSPFINKN